MTEITTTLVSAQPRPIQNVLQEHIRKTWEAYEHATLAQEKLMFSAWINNQYELAEIKAQKRRMQITWALLGGPLPKRRTKEA